MDYFLNDSNCVDRLFNEWKNYGSLIVAYDFDNTVFDYYQKGYKFEKVIELLRECKKMGFHLIVFTSCNDDRLPEIRSYLEEHDIPYNAVNETPDFIPFRGRKVYFNILLDDRAGLSSAYQTLSKTIYWIKGHNQNKSLTEIA